MDHNVAATPLIGNSMNQDVALGISMTVAQADLAPLRAAARLGEVAVVYRTNRVQLGGGFGDHDRHPLAWAVLVYVDGQVARVYSARGAGREWNSLDRLQRWLRAQGFWYWWTRNDLEPPGTATDQEREEEDGLTVSEPLAGPISGPGFAPLPG